MPIPPQPLTSDDARARKMLLSPLARRPTQRLQIHAARSVTRAPSVLPRLEVNLRGRLALASVAKLSAMASARILLRRRRSRAMLLLRMLRLSDSCVALRNLVRVLVASSSRRSLLLRPGASRRRGRC